MTEGDYIAMAGRLVALELAFEELLARSAFHSDANPVGFVHEVRDAVSQRIERQMHVARGTTEENVERALQLQQHARAAAAALFERVTANVLMVHEERRRARGPLGS